MNIDIDPELCIGAGECVLSAPMAFALDDHDVVSRVLKSADDEDRTAIRNAVDGCPTGAIRWTP